MSNFEVNAQVTIEEGAALYSVQQDVLDTLRGKGFASALQPRILMPGGQEALYQGQLPPDLTSLTDQQLGQYMGMMADWLKFVREQEALALADMNKAVETMELVAARLRVTYKFDERNKKRTEQERKDMVVIDRRYVQAKQAELKAEAVYRIIKAIGAGAEYNYSALSRRVTQRQQEVDHDKRNVGVVGQGPLFRR